MIGVEEELVEGGVDHLLSAHSELAEWPPRAREIFVELLGSYILQAPDHGHVVQSDLGTELWAELEEDLIFLSTLPLWCWGFREMEDLSQRERFTYLLNALSALLVAVRGAGQDHSLKDYPESLLPTLRRAAGEPVELSERARKRAERLEAMLGADRSGG